MNIFAVPFAGGNCYCYRDLARAISSGFEWETLELPGRGKRPGEPLLDSIEAMADDVVDQIISRSCEEFRLYGHSMGGLVAHRAAQIFEQRHQRCSAVEHLFVSGCRPPGLMRPLVARASLSRSELISAIDRLGGLPRQIREDSDLMAFFEPILRADFSAVDRYSLTERQPIAAPITVFSGKQDSEVDSADIERWCEAGAQQTRFFSFPGNHFFMLDHPSHISRIICATKQGESNGMSSANG